MSNDNQKRDGCFCAGAFETLHFCFGEPFCLKLKNQPLISANQSLITKKKSKHALQNALQRLKHQEKLVGKKKCTSSTTAAAIKPAKTKKNCYLDTVDEPIHEECVLGKHVV